MEKLLEQGYRVSFFKNQLGSITATAEKQEGKPDPQIITDTFSWEIGLSELIKKVLYPPPKESLKSEIH